MNLLELTVMEKILICMLKLVKYIITLINQIKTKKSTEKYLKEI